jgi:ferric-dicitrate binding protein FerR (iron transport regulator)
MLRWVWAAAAAVVVGVGAYAGWRRHVQAAPLTRVAMMNAVYTGSNATVPVEQRLPDGTTFRLGRRSTLRLYGTWTRERTLQLIGDGYFEVTSDARPFIVQTDHSVTRVLGTKFFVNASHKDASVRVGVLSGRVAVASDKSPTQMSVLDSGYVGNVSSNGKTTVAFDPNIAQDIGWVHGAYVMHNTSLPDVMAYLSDRFDFHMVAAPGTHMSQGHVTGTFPADYSLFECLKALKMTVGLRYVWYGDKLVVARLPYHQLVHDKPVEWMPPDSIAEAPPARLTPPPDPTPERLRGGSPRGGLTFVPDTTEDEY